MAGTLEKKLEQRLVKVVERNGGMCWKFISPGTPGVPDRICLLPGGRIIFVEMKAEWGRMANIQKYRKDQLTRLGYDARTIKGETQLQNFIQELEARA